MGHRSRALLALLALVATPSAGWAAVAATEPAVEILDVAAIQAGPIRLTLDPSGRSATLEVETTVDVACAVVYGTDATFGSIATDADMGGAAHRRHQAVLGGLTPDTTYVYRVQGSDAEGRLYVGEIRSFRTPPVAAAAPGDLARGATVSGVSSEHSPSYAAALAIDGDASTAWSSAGDGDDAWIELDLGRVASVAGVAFRTRSMSDGSAVTRTFTLTADGRELGTFAADELVPVTTEARVLRFDVAESSGGNTGAVEIEVVAAPAG